MKRTTLLILALAITLTACGAPAVEPTAYVTPTPTPENFCETDFVAGPEEQAYTYNDEKLGLTLFIPDEFAPFVALSEGIEFWDENGDIRPDEPITTTEAVQALFVVAEIGYPTPGGGL